MKYPTINYIKNVFLLILAASAFTTCKKIPDGFLSDLVRYEEDPIIIQKGRTKVSSGLNFDGSSKPTKITMLHIYEKATGKNVDTIFSKKYTIKAWKALYDPKADTTVALIEAKQMDMEVTPIIINESSGQVEANYTTLYVPSGNYEFDLQISNGAETKTYPKLGQIQIVDAPPFETNPTLGSPYVRMIKVGNESVGTNTTNTSVKVARIADQPNKVIVKIVDKNNVPFNPLNGEIARRPNGSSVTQPFLQTLQDYSLKTDLFADRTEFTFGTLPFPLNSLGNGFNIYYRIPTQFFSNVNQVLYPDGLYSANPRFQFRCYVPGTYTITFKANDLTHK